ncbi:MAG: hypothetical protein WCZ89_02380 [Phycisphaerae bacterium]
MKTHSLAMMIVTALVFLSAGLAWADTFTEMQTKEVLHGYATGEYENGRAVVMTAQKGRVTLNLAQWQVSRDRKGRNNKVFVFSIDGGIMYEIETAAFEQALKQAASQGPLFILIEIDTPGGRIDLARRICAAISDISNCQIIGYVKSGENGGALSAGAAVSFACNQLYMASDTVIGAATMITAQAETMKKAYGDKVGEKFDSAWRAMLASMAEKNARPGILARAMVDSDLEVIEVEYNTKRWFIEPINKRDDMKMIKSWSTKGSLLTLTAAEAQACGITDGVVESREELFKLLDAQNVEIIEDRSISDARTELSRAEGQLGRIRKSVDLKVKQSQNPMYQAEALRMLREARAEFRTLINLARKYPDLQLDIIGLENELNSIEAAYQNIKKQSARRR